MGKPPKPLRRVKLPELGYGARLTRTSAVILASAGVNALGGIVTGPLQARALGPVLRGNLTTATVPFVVISIILGFGLNDYVTRQVLVKNGAPSQVFNVMVQAIVAGVVFVPLGLAISLDLARGNHDLFVVLAVESALMPVILAGNIAYAAAIGEERWRAIFLGRTIPAVLSIAVVCVTYLTQSLTLLVAAYTAVGCQVLAAILPFRRSYLIMRRCSISIMKEAISFGLRSWSAGVVAFANQRVDLLLLALLGTRRQLGFYAVATAVGTLPGLLATSAMLPLKKLAAEGNGRGVASTVALTMAVTASTAALGIVLAPLIIPALMGAAFRPSVPMLQILLLAQVPLSGVVMLTSALTSAGYPGSAGVGECVALAMSVIALLLTIRRFGGMAAAWVSVGAYSLSLLYLVNRGSSVFRYQRRNCMVPRREDLRSLVRAVWAAAFPKISA